jgi:hypothetical protein
MTATSKHDSVHAPGWNPYCLVCTTMERMERRDYGWECVACHNKIGFDLKRLGHKGDE